ncbi:hypothetical protein MN032_13720 [Agromyces atrinae]|uniref:hypothetical protein n=1 Tax=Agromyces atrinae TaxID=592376 RepID=UPI001F58C6F2|nr:hypothetical protein [Agromyces atrinae]MCI2958752.1 hypothetical protein [Agromyces atrinae]
MLTHFRADLRAAGHSTGTAKQRLGHIKQLRLSHPDLMAVTDRKPRDARGCVPHDAQLGGTKGVSVVAPEVLRLDDSHAARSDRYDLGLASISVATSVPRIAPGDALQVALIAATLQRKAMILLARFGCLRLTELTAMHTSHRDRHLLRVTGKADKTRYVPATDELHSMLLELEREQGTGY